MSNTLNNLSVRTKIIGIAIVLIALILISNGYALFSMNQVGKELQSIAHEDIPMTQKLTKATEYQLEQAIHLERALRHGELLDRKPAASEHFKAEIAAFDKLSKQIDVVLKECIDFTETAIAVAETSEEAGEFRHIRDAVQQISGEHKDFEDHAHQIYALFTEGKGSEAEGLFEKIEHEEAQLTHELESLLAEIEKFTEAASQRAEAHEHAAMQILTVILIGALLAGIILSWLLSANVSQRLGKAARSLEVIASGDLTQPVVVDGLDEIGKLEASMHKMQSNLQAMLAQINQTTDLLSTAAEEVSVVTKQSSANIQQQQSEMDQMATAMNEMSATVKEVAENVASTSAAANSANLETQEGRGIVENTVQEINRLAETIESAAEVITNVEHDSDNINKVLDVIKGIAEQTNLLALNAAIEAARAGEQGRGFAVVADEVRTLAVRTQESTSEINQIIEKLQSGSRHAVETMASSREQARAVVEKATLAGQSLQTIETSVAQIDDMSAQIATAAEEQTAVAEDMNQNIIRISDMATQNATGAEQTAQAGAELSAMSVELKNLVAKFKTL